MKLIGTILLLFLFLIPTLPILSQEDEEWRWRENLDYNWKKRVVNRTIYTDYHFTDYADFRRTLFESPTKFNNAHFSSRAEFIDAKFFSSANFYKTFFDGSTNFSSADFFKEAIFTGTEFSSEAEFNRTEFDSSAYFVLAIFKSMTDFSESKFKSRTSFRGAQFKKYVTFREAEFHAETDFTYAVLPPLLDFSYVITINHEIDFTKIKLDTAFNTCRINLTGANIDRIRFRYKRFKLWFPPSESIEYEIKTNVYEDLLKKQKVEGFTQSLEILDKEYREFQYTAADGDYSWIWGHTLNWIDKNWWGYGYNKELIIRNVILIYLLLALINAFWLKYLTTSVYANESIQELWAARKNKGWLNRAFSSFWYSLFYTAIIFFGFKFDMEKLKYKENLDGWKRLNLLYFFTIYLGGLVCLAYLANYVITV